MQFTIRTLSIIAALLDLSLAVPRADVQTNTDMASRDFNITQGGGGPHGDVGCSGKTFSVPDQLNARSQMIDWCKTNKVPSSDRKVWTYGSAEVYICNYDGNADSDCDNSNWEDAINFRVGPTCGANYDHGGWVHYYDWQVAYGMDAAGTSECW